MLSIGSRVSKKWNVFHFVHRSLTQNQKNDRIQTRNNIKCILLYVLQPTGVLYHSHLGEVDQVVLSVVGRPLLDEGQVSQVHSQVGNTGRVTAEDKRCRQTSIVHKQMGWLQCVSTEKWQVLDTHFFRASLRFLNRPSDDTSFCNLSITVFVWRKDQSKTEARAKV